MVDREMVSPSSIYTYLDAHVAGQEHLKRTLSNMGYMHLVRMRNMMHDYYSINPPRPVPLIAGPTGTGKTLSAETLAEYLQLPLCRIVASELSKEGFVGNSLQDIMLNFVEQHYYDKSLNKNPWFDYSIIFIDEVDKLGHHLSASEVGNWTVQIQNSLLSILEGKPLALDTYRRNTNVKSLDTTGFLVILAGAFEDAYKHRTLDSSSMGFTGKLRNYLSHGTHHEAYDQPLSASDMEKAGLRRELIGRITTTTYTKPLTRDDIRYALSNVFNSIYDQYATLFHLSGREMYLSVDDENIIIERIYNSPYGMRYANNVVYEVFADKISTLSGITSEEHQREVEEYLSRTLPFKPEESSDDIDDPQV